MDEWRNYLKNANVDIFDIIKNAIIVAASDHPNEFRIKRDKFAEALFSRELINAHCENKEDVDNRASIVFSNVCGQGVAEVLRVITVLEKCGMRESEESVVCELLKKLQDMGLSMETLEVTGIGKSVSALRKHESKDVKETAREMIKDWKRMVEERMESDEKKSVVVQENEEESGIKQVVETQVVPMSKPQRPKLVRIKLKKAQVYSDKDNMQSKDPAENSDGAAEVSKIKWVAATRKSGDESRSDQLGGVMCDQQCKKPMDFEVASTKDQKGSNGNIEEKMEATKRKLQHGYKMAENMKKKPKIQVMELYELTNQGLLPTKNQLVKPLNKQNRKCSIFRF